MRVPRLVVERAADLELQLFLHVDEQARQRVLVILGFDLLLFKVAREEDLAQRLHDFNDDVAARQELREQPRAAARRLYSLRAVSAAILPRPVRAAATVHGVVAITSDHGLHEAVDLLCVLRLFAAHTINLPSFSR